MHKILITGADGMLGQDLTPILEDEGYEVIETNKDTLDVTNFEMAKKAIESAQPDLVIHCAAYTNVDKAEEEPEIVNEINVKGTENVAKICAQSDIPIIYISTDYVFDGEKKEPYLPDDTPNPVNIYGKSKFEGEKAVQKHCKKYYIVRTSWLYGHYGRNFVETILAISDRPEVKVVNDQIGCPTWTVELSNEIIKLLGDEYEYGIYHICGDGEISWYDFAKEIFKLTGKKVNLLPCTTEEFPRPAKRPKHSSMATSWKCRNWKSALKDYINLR